MSNLNYHAVVLGVSAGAYDALSVLLSKLPKSFPVPIIVICHRTYSPENYLTEHLSTICSLQVRDVENLEKISNGTIYIAPPGYHVLITDDYNFNLSADLPVNYSIPSIDVTFENAAEVYGKQLIGIVLTGANSDGAYGLSTIKLKKGYTMVQDPKTAMSSFMPEAALKKTEADFVGTLDEIAEQLCALFNLRTVSNGR